MLCLNNRLQAALEQNLSGAYRTKSVRTSHIDAYYRSTIQKKDLNVKQKQAKKDRHKFQYEPSSTMQTQRLHRHGCAFPRSVQMCDDA
jgi:hypothetical protein